ncbi:MAG: hypothetical protein HY331_11010 [Chloroflexi bacterium]|nr:hypothetical protein [Chloroflexota bacterium]
MANQMGKRYFCTNCGSEMLVTRSGKGELSCCGKPMELRGSTAPAKAQAEPAPQEVKHG